MQFTHEVQWTTGDFIVMALLLGSALGAYEWITRIGDDAHFRLGGALAIIGSLLLLWANLAVGIIGSEHNPINAIFFAIPLIGIAIAALGRFGRAGITRALTCMVVLQLATAIVAYFAEGEHSALLTAAFAVFWSSSAVAFTRSNVTER